MSKIKYILILILVIISNGCVNKTEFPTNQEFDIAYSELSNYNTNLYEYINGIKILNFEFEMYNEIMVNNIHYTYVDITSREDFKQVNTIFYTINDNEEKRMYIKNSTLHIFTTKDIVNTVYCREYKVNPKPLCSNYNIKYTCYYNVDYNNLRSISKLKNGSWIMCKL